MYNNVVLLRTSAPHKSLAPDAVALCSSRALSQIRTLQRAIIIVQNMTTYKLWQLTNRRRSLCSASHRRRRCGVDWRHIMATAAGYCSRARINGLGRLNLVCVAHRALAQRFERTCEIRAQTHILSAAIRCAILDCMQQANVLEWMHVCTFVYVDVSECTRTCVLSNW